MKIAIIGLRGHVWYAVDDLCRLKNIEVPAISAGCDDDIMPLLDGCRKAGFEPQIYADWRLMLDEVKPDVVVIDGPFDSHAQMCVYALDRNIHVFCEKPISLDWKGLEEIKRSFEKSSAHLLSMVGLRYQEDFQTALELVRAGAVGKVKLISTRKSYRLGERPDFYRKRSTYGGTIPWVGSHAFDWIMAFSGSGFDTIWASHTTDDNRGHGELEIACQTICTMKNGVQGQASIDFLRPMTAPSHGDDQVRVAGTDGVLEVREGKITLIDKDGFREISVNKDVPHIFEDFVTSLQTGKACWVTDKEAFLLTEAVLAARDSADTGELYKVGGF